MHGNLTLLHRALAEGARRAGTDRLDVVLIGDYVDNGPEIPALLQFLSEVQAAGGVHGRFRIMPILGNHEMAMLLSTVPGVFGTAEDVDRWWARWPWWWNADSGTVAAYGCEPATDWQMREGRASAADGRRERFRAAVPAEHLAFVEALPWHLAIGPYVFVHAGLVPELPADKQLAFLEARDLGALERHTEYHMYRFAQKGRRYGMPDQIASKEISNRNDPKWGRIVVSGHKKYKDGNDYVASHRLGLHSCACMRVFDPAANPLHCALLKRTATDLTRPDDAPELFEVHGEGDGQ